MSRMHYLMATSRVPKLVRGSFGIVHTWPVRRNGDCVWLSRVEGPDVSTVVELMREYQEDGCCMAMLAGFDCAAV